MIVHAFRGWGRNLGPTSTGRAAPKLARAAPLQDGDFQDAPGTQVPTGIERVASKLARVAPLQDGAFQDAPGTQVPTGIERAASKLARVAPLQDVVCRTLQDVFPLVLAFSSH